MTVAFLSLFRSSSSMVLLRHSEKKETISERRTVYEHLHHTQSRCRCYSCCESWRRETYNISRLYSSSRIFISFWHSIKSVARLWFVVMFHVILRLLRFALLCSHYIRAHWCACIGDVPTYKYIFNIDSFQSTERMLNRFILIHHFVSRQERHSSLFYFFFCYMLFLCSIYTYRGMFEQ